MNGHTGPSRITKPVPGSAFSNRFLHTRFSPTRYWQIARSILWCVAALSCSWKSAIANEWTIETVASIGSSDRAQTGVIKNVLLRQGGEQAVACGMDGTVTLWDLNTGRIIRRFADPEMEGIYCMSLLDDGKRLLAAGIGPGVMMWDIESGEKLRQFDHSTTIYSIDVLADGQSFVCGDDDGKTIHFALDQDDPIATYRQGAGDITSLCVLPDQSGFVTGDGDGVVSVWAFGNEKRDSVYEGLENWVCCLRFDEDGDQLFGSDYSGNIVLWNVADRESLWKKEALSGDICWGHFVSDTMLVVVDTSDAFYLLDRDSGKATKKSIVIPEAAGFDLSDDQKTIWTGGTNLVCGWNLENGDRVFPDDESMAFAQGINSTVVHRDRVYVAATRPRIIVWNLETGEREKDFEFRSSLNVDWEDFHIQPSSQGLMICCDEGYVLLDYESGAVLRTKKLAASNMVPSPNSDLMTFADRQQFRLRQIDPLAGTPQTLAQLDDENAAAIDSFVFMDANTIAVVIDDYPQKMQIWSVPAQKPVGHLVREDGFDLKSGAPGLLVGMDFESNPIVFASERREQGPLNQKSIADLIDQLDHDSYEVREQAMNRLIGGGELVADAINLIEPDSLETRVRIARIQQSMSHAMVPDLNQPLTPDPNLDETVEVVCADPFGQYFLMTVRNGWKSDLLVCQVQADQWDIVLRHPLRSRASSMVSLNDSPNRFSIGYQDGTIDLIQVHAR